MKKHMIRLLSLFLALTLAVSPLTVFAEAAEEEELIEAEALIEEETVPEELPEEEILVEALPEEEDVLPVEEEEALPEEEEALPEEEEALPEEEEALPVEEELLVEEEVLAEEPADTTVLGTDIIYYLDDGENNPANPDFYADSSNAKITLKAPYKEGYTFVGWYKDSHFAIKAAAPQITRAIADKCGGALKFYALWRPDAYKIVFKANGGTGTMAAMEDIAIYDEVTLRANKFTRKGYDFIGWNTAADGSGNGFENREEVSALAEADGSVVTLYAQWDPHAYEIVFVDGEDEETEYYFTTEEYNLNKPEKEGYKFLGWYNGSTKVTKIKKGTTGDMKLTAKWQVKSFKIKYVLNGGTMKKGLPTKYVYDEYAFLNAVKPTKKGSHFEGWEIDGEIVTELEPYTYTDNIVLSAVWSPYTYSITYDENGGFETDNPTEYNYGDETFALEPAVRPGYKFQGWYNGKTKLTKIKKGTAEDLFLTAKWAPVSYTIKYVLAGGKNPSGMPTKYNYKDFISFDGKHPTKKGYIFDGWYTDADFTDPFYGVDRETYGDLKLYAKWDIVEYEIEYLNSEDVEHENPTTYTVEDSIKLLPPEGREGYTFKGWYNISDKKVTAIKKGSTGDLMLEPRWSAISYKIRYVLNGGTAPKGNPSSYTIETNRKLIAPTKKGYTFGGWYLDKDLTEPFDMIERGTITGSLTLYAEWVGSAH